MGRIGFFFITLIILVFSEPILQWSTHTQVNKYELNNQEDPGGCSFPNGDYIIGWESDTDTFISARLFFSDGTPKSKEIQLVEVVGGTTFRRVSIECFLDGSFIVLYQEYAAQYLAWCQKYDKNGQTVGDRFSASDLSGHRYPDGIVKRNELEDYVVIYHRLTTARRTEAQLFQKVDNSKGIDILVDDRAIDEHEQVFSALSLYDSTGQYNGFIIGHWKNNYGAYYRAYDSEGAPITALVDLTALIGSTTIDEVGISSCRGEFIITYVEDVAPGRRLIGKRYSSVDGSEVVDGVFVIDTQREIQIWYNVQIISNDENPDYAHTAFWNRGDTIESTHFNSNWEQISPVDYVSLYGYPSYSPKGMVRRDRNGNVLGVVIGYSASSDSSGLAVFQSLLDYPDAQITPNVYQPAELLSTDGAWVLAVGTTLGIIGLLFLAVVVIVMIVNTIAVCWCLKGGKSNDLDKEMKDV